MKTYWMWVVSLLVLGLVACSDSDGSLIPGTPDGGTDGGTDTCIDNDGDGYGEGCELGPDCDDDDPRNFPGNIEVCDGQDNNCDGVIDEFVGELCAECTPSCAAFTYPPSSGWDLNEDNSGGAVVIDEDGRLTLAIQTNPSFSVWIANTGEGTVSKLDAESGAELARYPSVLTGGSHGAFPWDNECHIFQSTELNVGNCPSRTAVDQEFNAYVANRAFGGQGTVTKYLENIDECDPDNNGVPGIQTSVECNGIPGIQLECEDIDGCCEFPQAAGIADDCIEWTVPVGAVGGTPRALAVGRRGEGNRSGIVWVGLNGAGTVATNYANKQPELRGLVALDPQTGLEVTARSLSNLDITDIRPYGMATGPDGKVWVIHRTHIPVDFQDGELDLSQERRDVLGFIDPITGVYQVASSVPGDHVTDPLRAYGIAVDINGKVYVAVTHGPKELWRYEPTAGNPVSGTWTGIATDNLDSDYEGAGRGLAIDSEHIWVALSHRYRELAPQEESVNWVAQYKLSDLSPVQRHDLPLPCRAPVGVGIGGDRSVWAVCNGVGIVEDSGFPARRDPQTGNWTAHIAGESPYTYSDFAGFGINFIADPGYHRFVVQGCPDGLSIWEGVSFTASFTADHVVDVYVRSAQTQAQLSELTEADWLGPFANNERFAESPNGPVPNGRYLEVEIRLRSLNPATAPYISDMAVVSTCERPVF